MAEASDVPQVQELVAPTMNALRKLGGSARIQEISDQVARDMKLSPDVAGVSHLGSTTQTELQYRLAWARTHLKNAGLIENSRRGVWSVTKEGSLAEAIDAAAIVKATSANRVVSDEDALGEDPEAPWKEMLLARVRQMDPYAFERLCQLILRESGFESVTVTKASGDGGIDGRGILRLGRLISFPVVFECKRYGQNVGPEIVRAFRGSMDGRAERGLLMTTAGFTDKAREEANRLASQPVDLVDGDMLAELMKDFGLGVKIQTEERVTINKDWFDEF